jgi:catechol 2,3-dioxygenase-like lactoylglutathione lyase family enzyme
VIARGLDHVSVAVADLDRSLDFYHRLLGVPVLGRGEEDGPPVSGPDGKVPSRFLYADLALGRGQILELLQYLAPKRKPVHPTPYAPGGGHLGIRVADLDVTLRRLRRAGVRPWFRPVRLASPAWWAGARIVYVSDPDGTAVELVERSRRAPGQEGVSSRKRRSGGKRPIATSARVTIKRTTKEVRTKLGESRTR